MSDMKRIEQALATTLASAQSPDGPPRLAETLRYAVFPGGARIRPRLCLAVARACREDDPAVTDAAAAAIEMLHCASLVHDDLPCFDDAPMRRGKPSVHRAYGERLAVLGGDALIVLAFQALADGCRGRPERLGPLVSIISAAVGSPQGIVAGQAWECEPFVELGRYQRSKTGALFAAATEAGAAAAGVASAPWRLLGDRLGKAYQMADDIRDVVGDPAALGKPVGQDATHGRPNGAGQYGLDGAVKRLESLLAGTLAAIPHCAGADALREHILTEAKGLLPAGHALQAA